MHCRQGVRAGWLEICGALCHKRHPAPHRPAVRWWCALEVGLLRGRCLPLLLLLLLPITSHCLVSDGGIHLGCGLPRLSAGAVAVACSSACCSHLGGVPASDTACKQACPAIAVTVPAPAPRRYDQLMLLMEGAIKQGVKRIRLHVLSGAQRARNGVSAALPAALPRLYSCGRPCTTVAAVFPSLPCSLHLCGSPDPHLLQLLAYRWARRE